jgi:hypothetical protein
MPPDFWIAIEKGLQHYTRNASQNNKGAAAAFPGTFNNPRNLLRQAFREQDEIGRSGIFKGRIATQWKVYTAQHVAAKGIKLKMQEWAPKLIKAMWDHTTRIWHYRNDAVHSRDNKHDAQYRRTGAGKGTNQNQTRGTTPQATCIPIKASRKAGSDRRITLQRAEMLGRVSETILR